jgi:hypothetical protein
MFFTFWPDLGNTPARVNRFTGEIQINNRYFRNMPGFRKRFIIEHEKGHFNLDTRSEFEADDYAFRKLAGTRPFSLKESVKSISQVLSFTNPEHLQRMTEVVKKALDYDHRHNGNQKAGQALDQLNEIIKNQKLNQFNMNSNTENGYFEPEFGGTAADDIYDNAKGRAKRQARKAARQEKRQEKKTTRQANRATRKANRPRKNKGKRPILMPRFANKAAEIAWKRKSQSRGSWRPGDQNQPVNTPITTPTINDPIQPDDVLMEQSYPVDETSASYPQQVYPEEQYPEEEYPEEEGSEEDPGFFDEDGNNTDPNYYDDEYDNGAGKARRAERKKNREEKRKLKNEKKAAKVEVIKARAEAKKTRAGAKMELAKQGKSGTDWLGGAIDTIGGLFGKKSAAEDSGDYTDEGGEIPEEPAKLLGMPKGVAIAVIVLLLLTIVGVVIFVVKRKK